MADHAHNLTASFHSTRGPVGVITRGTTHANRLRRCDRWMRYHPRIQQILRHADKPLALDVGYGASWFTTVEWAQRLRVIRPDLVVKGLEINPERIQAPRDNVFFELGGFELAGYRPDIVRAFNVLRQYDVEQVPVAWETVTSRLAPGGVFIEGTCDEIGRRCSWVLLDQDGPQTLTLAWDPHDVQLPSDIAERLPKVLIHRNIAGEKIYDLLRVLDDAWNKSAGWAPFGPRVRWRQALSVLQQQGLAIVVARRPLRDNLITIPWNIVAD